MLCILGSLFLSSKNPIAFFFFFRKYDKGLFRFFFLPLNLFFCANPLQKVYQIKQAAMK